MRAASDPCEPLDLGDHHAAVVVGGEGLVEDAERSAFVLRCEVAELVGGRGPDDRDVDRDRPQVEPLAAIEVDDLDDVLGRLAFMRPPCRRGSMKVSLPTSVRTPGCPTAAARCSWNMMPDGML